MRLHRVVKAPPGRVFRAFLDADALCRWLPPYGFLGKIEQLDARMGGGYRMSFRNFGTGHVHAFGGSFVELVPHEKIRISDRFDDPTLPGEMTKTIRLQPVLCGTKLDIVQKGVPAVIPI